MLNQTNQATHFIRYNCVFVVTVIVITEFNCSCKKQRNKVIQTPFVPTEQPSPNSNEPNNVICSEKYNFGVIFSHTSMTLRYLVELASEIKLLIEHTPPFINHLP